MVIVKISTKGQIVLPKKIREDLDIKEDTYLVIERIGDNILIKKAESRFDEITKMFSEAAKKKGITKEELLQYLKENKNEDLH